VALDTVVIFIILPSALTIRRLVATTVKPLMYEASMVRESRRFKATGADRPAGPLTIESAPLKLAVYSDIDDRPSGLGWLPKGAWSCDGQSAPAGREGCRAVFMPTKGLAVSTPTTSGDKHGNAIRNLIGRGKFRIAC
jgi:hypothetical protein